LPTSVAHLPRLKSSNVHRGRRGTAARRFPRHRTRSTDTPATGRPARPRHGPG
jgi:hypothetical protein